MIGWIFKRGMAAVGWDEKFQAIHARFDALEDRLTLRLGEVASDCRFAIDRLDKELRAEIKKDVRADFTSTLANSHTSSHIPPRANRES